MISWKIGEEGFDPEKIAANGNKYLVGNGYMGIRGTLEEHGKEQLAAVNLAGIYDRAGSGWRESLNAPNGLYINLKADGRAYVLPGVAPKEHIISLDYRKALFSRKTTWKTERGHVSVESERFASMAEPHLAVLKYSVYADYCAEIEITEGIDADIWEINGPHYDTVELVENAGHLFALCTTRENREKVCVVESCQFDFDYDFKTRLVAGERFICRQMRFTAAPGVKYVFIKWIAVFTGKDHAEPVNEAVRLVDESMKKGYTAVRQEHIGKWEEKWQVSEVVIEGDDMAMEALNYSIYHLHSIAPRHSDSLSIPARGLSGQTYKGAVFWDTEMFMLDFFLYTEPSVARSLVKYRIDTLEGAKSKARDYGFEGAFYAWESQEGGYDACSDYNVVDVFTGRPMRTYFKDKQIHVSSAVVHAIMRYVDITGDMSVLCDGGAEVVIECARFYYSLLLKRVAGEAYELHDVVGPDEYHERVNNNGYTNRMAKFTFDMAIALLDTIDELPEDTAKRLRGKYPPDEMKQKFLDASSRLYIPKPDEEGIIEQFDGYGKLEDVALEDLRKRLLDEREYWGGAYGIASQTKIIKQADVVAWLALFPEDFPVEILEKNWNYYEPRTEHGSSLSACMHALLALYCGKPEKAYPFFIKSARADLDGTGKQWAGLVYIGGTHPAAAGGAYMTAVKGFGGISFEGGEVRARPRLPRTWKRLSFKVMYRGRLYLVDVTEGSAVVTELALKN
ncbi:MAG: glycosyl hydrolase family 65 protein [Bacillota bacterium]